jgi:hypothetical protein
MRDVNAREGFVYIWVRWFDWDRFFDWLDDEDSTYWDKKLFVGVPSKRKMCCCMGGNYVELR